MRAHDRSSLRVLASTGEPVAVKVQRPNIQKLVNMDLSTIRFVIWIISRFVNTNEFIDLRAFSTALSNNRQKHLLQCAIAVLFPVNRYNPRS